MFSEYDREVGRGRAGLCAIQDTHPRPILNSNLAIELVVQSFDTAIPSAKFQND